MGNEKRPALDLAKALKSARPLTSATEATSVDFGTFVHGQSLAFPFTFRGFTFVSPFSPDPTKVIDLTTFGDPALENTWLSNGISLSPSGVFIVFPKPTDLCSMSVFPDSPSPGVNQLRFEWYDAGGLLLGEKEIGGADTLPTYQAYTHVIKAKGVLTVAAYSNRKTPLCRIQALIP